MNKVGQRLLTDLEGIRYTAYLCPAGVWTIGRGHTKGVKEGDRITKEEEQALFEADIAEWEAEVLKCLIRRPNENQLAAFVIFAFNIGIAGFRTSTALKRFEDYNDAAVVRAMGLWNKITVTDKETGKKIKIVNGGLVARRAREGALFMTPPWEVPGMPQEVVPEKPMTQSTITQASVVAGVTTTSAAITAITESINSVKDSFGDFVVPVLLIVTLCAVGYIAWERFNLRREGQA